MASSATTATMATAATAQPDRESPFATRVDAVIVGAGFAGMYMLHRLRQLGLAVQLFERGSGVGGTWFWNRYPGARCDVESLEYSYQFDEQLQQQWQWSQRYAGQPEILRYANHVADRFDLRQQMRFNTSVQRATFDEAAARWQVTTSDNLDIACTYLIMATGCLSSTNMPNIAGRDSFTGEQYHTGNWPQQPVDFSGKAVAVIGTGSSAVQSIPIIAQQAAKLYVLQRTATYTVPAHNDAMDPQQEASVKAEYAAFRARNSQMIGAFGSHYPRSEVPVLTVTPSEREQAFEERWRRGGLSFMGAFGDLILNSPANEVAANFVRGKIAQIVSDPKTAALLTPKHVIGCKRLCIDSDYYASFNRDNVQLVDISQQPINRIDATGIRVGGQHYAVDSIVFATGFDAMTGSLLRIEICGRGGERLQDAWAAGPRTYLGLMVAGFPNLFMISGPGSPSVLTNMLVSIEQHVNFIADCVAYLRQRNLRLIEARNDAQQAWVAHVNAVADTTLYPGCNSWYVGANVPGKTRVFMPLLGYPPYVEKCKQVVAQGYAGFALA